MAPRKEVPSLVDIALQSIENYITNVCYDSLNKDQSFPEQYVELCKKLRESLYGNTAPAFHGRFGRLCLKALNTRFYQQNFLTGYESDREKGDLIVSKLAVIILTPKLEALPKCLPEPIVRALLEALDRMPGLKELACSTFLSSVGVQEFVDAIQRSTFSNLSCFSAEVPSCTDRIIEALCENCLQLRVVSLRSSGVSDACIPYLSSCKKLESVDLCESEISASGVFQLLTETKSAALKTVLVSCSRSFLELLNNKENCPRFQQENLGLCVENEQHLEIVVNFFPLLKKLVLSSIEFPNFSRLVSLVKLTKLLVVIGDGKHHRLRHFLTIKGLNITSLTIYCENDLSLTALINICSLCNNLEELRVSYPPPSDGFTPVSNCVSNEFHGSFRKLKLFSALCTPLGFVKIILRHAPNLKKVVLGGRSIDECFDSVFECDCLVRLEFLCFLPKSQIISESLLEKVVKSCEKLRYIKYMYPNGRPDLKLFQNFQNFIRLNNYDVVFNRVEERNPN